MATVGFNLHLPNAAAQEVIDLVSKYHFFASRSELIREAVKFFLKHYKTAEVGREIVDELIAEEEEKQKFREGSERDYHNDQDR